MSANPHLIVDLSHANSKKIHTNQLVVAKDVASQLRDGNNFISWIMIEGNINGWSQKFNPGTDDPSKLRPWVSITDACSSLKDTEEMFDILNKAVAERNS